MSCLILKSSCLNLFTVNRLKFWPKPCTPGWRKRWLIVAWNTNALPYVSTLVKLSFTHIDIGCDINWFDSSFVCHRSSWLAYMWNGMRANTWSHSEIHFTRVHKNENRIQTPWINYFILAKFKSKISHKIAHRKRWIWNWNDLLTFNRGWDTKFDNELLRFGRSDASYSALNRLIHFTASTFQQNILHFASSTEKLLCHLYDAIFSAIEQSKFKFLLVIEQRLQNVPLIRACGEMNQSLQRRIIRIAAAEFVEVNFCVSSPHQMQSKWRTMYTSKL